MVIRPNLLSHQQLIFLSKVYSVSLVNLITTPLLHISFPVYSLLNKILEGYPIEYALGFAEFAGISLVVDDSVLLPRWETEEWVQYFATMCLDEKNKNESDIICVDLGCGSACISAYIRHHYPSTKIVCVDKSPKALLIAQYNMKDSVSHTRFIESNWLENSHISECIKEIKWILFCNPPYVPLEDIKDKTKNGIQYEPESAIFSGDDGLDDFRIILTQLADFCNLPQYVFFELDPRNIEAAHSLFIELFPDMTSSLFVDSLGQQRVLVATNKYSNKNRRTESFSTSSLYN